MDSSIVIRININSDNVVEYTNKLERLHRSALPVAIRGALNDTAYKMKKTTLPKVAKSFFEERQQNFFKANSRVEGAVGFDINKMVASVGFVSTGLHNKSTNYAVRDLEQQEHGGTIGGRSFKPLPSARIGGTGNVRANVRVAKLLKAGNIVDSRYSRQIGKGAANKMQEFIKASLHAGVGGYVLGGKLLWKVTQIKRSANGNTVFKKQKLFSFKKNGTAKVLATGFARKAALEVQKEMEFFYILQATKQINKVMR